MISVKEWLIKNPREKGELELDMLEIAINCYHIISLLWDRTTRKYTDNFLIYKIQETIELFINSLPEEVDFADLYDRMKESYDQAKKLDIKQSDILKLFGREVDNYLGNEYGLVVDVKIVLLIYLLELNGITKEQIFEKYQ